MQTFIPLACMTASLDALDKRRLGKQRVEAQQILNALEARNGWSHHTAVRMWIGYRDALICYRNAAIKLWVARGGRNTMPILEHGEPVLPPWWGAAVVHSSHRARLLAKPDQRDPRSLAYRHYRAHGWGDLANPHGYAWPYAEADGSWWINDLRASTRRRYPMPVERERGGLIYGIDSTLLACSLPCCA